MSKNKIIKKFIIVLFIVIIILNFLIPNKSYAKWQWFKITKHGGIIFFTSVADGDEDIYDGGIDYFSKSGGGILLNPLFELCLSITDAINATMQKIMLSDESNNTRLGNIVEIANNMFDIMSDEKEDAEFDNGNISQDGLKIRILQKYQRLQYPHIHYSCEEIFSGKIGLLNINFISGDGQSEGLLNVRKIISSWYNALKLIAIIGFLSILIYTGIKIMTSSIAKDKAKYKEWLINWLVGFAILFFLHYIMSFIITIIDQFTIMLSDSMQYIHIGSFYAEKSLYFNEESGEFNTNLIGLVRFLAQSSVPIFKVGYLILYIMLTTYTVKFTIVYLKRLINMAFLTLIAPIVAFTYPIDKMADGQAQGFNAWLKEYIFNALLQPVHLLLYYILVGSSVVIAAENPLYAIAVLAFMTEGERLLKKIFGFDKATGFGTVKGMQDAIVGSAIASKMVGLLGKGKGEPEDEKAMEAGAINKDYQNANIDSGNNGGSGHQGNPPTSQTHSAPKPPQINGLASSKPMKKTNFERLVQNAANTDAGKSIRQMANTRVGRGMRAVGRKIVKPVWDTKKSAAWNKKRLKRKLIRGAVGTAVGLTAAAVQAGISLTDGKYDPIEGFTAFGAGFAFAGNKTEGLMNTYEAGTHENLLNSNLSDEEKQEKLEMLQEDFINRDDVIDFCQRNYGDNWKDYRERMATNFVSRGFSDLNEMKEMMKYSDKMTGNLSERNDLTPEEKRRLQEEQDASAMSIKEIQRQKAKEGTLKSVYNLDAENSEIEAKTAGMSAADAQREAKNIRDRNAAIRWYNNKLNE